MKCKTCGRELNISSDPLSLDCGGDCRGCVSEAEGKPLCSNCGKPILDKEARYTLYEPEKFMHYECWKKRHSPEAVRAAAEKAKKAIVDLDDVLRKAGLK